ncbi:MAG TPA: hypothetical protein VKW06_20160 [Candidatus Angelobacter sp.]|nr:hypothetical protein [Candidatus Angelobacter sp.]
MSQPSPALGARRPNSALWTGLLLVLLGIVSNFFIFWHIPGETVWPWVSLLLPAIGVLMMIVGLARAFRQPQIFRGKIAGSILTAVAALLCGLSTIGFFHARDIPASGGAPKVGQKAPDFTLTNTSGKSVSLSQLLTTPIDTRSGKAPKAVLLVFYRGWW